MPNNVPAATSERTATRIEQKKNAHNRTNGCCQRWRSSQGKRRRSEKCAFRPNQVINNFPKHIDTSAQHAVTLSLGQTRKSLPRRRHEQSSSFDADSVEQWACEQGKRRKQEREQVRIKFSRFGIDFYSFFVSCKLIDRLFDGDETTIRRRQGQERASERNELRDSDTCTLKNHSRFEWLTGFGRRWQPEKVKAIWIESLFCIEICPRISCGRYQTSISKLEIFWR